MIRDQSSLIAKGDRFWFELLALRLDVHGPTAATPHMVRSLARTPLWLELRCLLREHGFPEAEIAQLMGMHPKGCACWDCVTRLRRAVLRGLLRHVTHTLADGRARLGDGNAMPGLGIVPRRIAPH